MRDEGRFLSHDGGTLSAYLDLGYGMGSRVADWFFVSMVIGSLRATSPVSRSGQTFVAAERGLLGSALSRTSVVLELFADAACEGNLLERFRSARCGGAGSKSFRQS